MRWWLVAGRRSVECGVLVRWSSFCEEVRFTNLFRRGTRGPSFVADGKISADDPLEYDNDGEPGGGVES